MRHAHLCEGGAGAVGAAVGAPPAVDLGQHHVLEHRAVGKQVETYEPDNGPHGFYFGHPDLPESQEAAKRAVAFFKEQFAKHGKGQ
jgi:acetyl esterase/lipase